MQYQEFMQQIGLSEACISRVTQLAPAREEILSLPQAAFLDEPYTGDKPDYVLALFVHYLAEFSEAEYQKRGATHAEWLSSMCDLAIWSDYLQAERGEVGIRETHWLAHLVRTEIFRLGRLQFVPRVLSENTAFGTVQFPAGTPYCEIHIPAGEKLLPALVDESLARANKLFSPRFYTCESWLLSPKLKEFTAGGNVLAFASRFTLVSADLTSRSAERYIFGRIGDPRLYAPQNAFSARVKEGALVKNFVGGGFGYFLHGSEKNP